MGTLGHVGDRASEEHASATSMSRAPSKAPEGLVPCRSAGLPQVPHARGHPRSDRHPACPLLPSQFSSASCWLSLRRASFTESVSPPASSSPWSACTTSTRSPPRCTRRQLRSSHQPRSRGRARRETDPEHPIKLILCSPGSCGLPLAWAL